MPKSPWLYSSLCEKSGVFGEFEKCLTFCSTLQSASSGNAGSATSSKKLFPERKSLYSEEDVYTYLDTLQKASWDVCIVAFTSLNARRNGRLPLSVSRRLFEHITGAFNISSTFLTAFDTGVARYISPSTPNEIGGDWEQAQFVVQQNRSYSSFSIALTFNSKTGEVRALIFGMEKPLSDLLNNLVYISPLPFGPMIIPTIALELQAEGFSDTIKSCQAQVHDIENLTGMRQLNNAYECKRIETQDWKRLDLIGITRDLSSFLSRFAFLKLQAETGAYLVHQMQLSTESLKTELETRKEAKSKIGNQHEIHSKLEDLGSWFRGIQARCCYLTERTQAQVYNLVSLQDNLSNVAIARASRDIAEATQKDSQAMLLIAENSRRDNQLMLRIARDSNSVAESSARDSATMRAIAAVTVLFLPATFTAVSNYFTLYQSCCHVSLLTNEKKTFVSMTFFSFTNDAQTARASPWIWVYFLATVLLTIVVQTFWAVSNKAKEKKIVPASRLD